MNSSFPNRWSFSYLKFTKYVTNIIAEPKYKYGHCFSDLFADDATVHTSSPDLDTINEEFQTDFLKATYWSKLNKVPINFDKTTYMLLGARKRINDIYQLALSVDDITIKQVSKQKLLGIVIDDQLSWTPQRDRLCSILSIKFHFLRNYLPTYHRI